MDLSSTFKAEVYRPVVTIVIPGITALAPLAVGLGVNYTEIYNFAQQHAGLSSALGLLAAIACGFLLEDLGAHIENFWWSRIEGDAEARAEIEEEWYAYLRLAPECEPIGIGYIRTIVLRMKFETSFGLALLVSLCGLLWLKLSVLPQIPPALITAMPALSAYLLLFESRTSCQLLTELRHELLKKSPHDGAPRSTLNRFRPRSADWVQIVSL